MDRILQNIPPLVWGLIGLSLAAYVIGLVIGKYNEDRTRRIPVWTKVVMLTIAAIVGGIGWLGLAQGTFAEPYARWIFFGLVAGGIGDLILADVFPIKRSLIAGMAIFGIGHLCYLLGIFSLRSVIYPTPTWLEYAILIVPALFAAALMWEFLVRNPHGERMVNTGAFFYGMLLMVTVVFAAFFMFRSQIMFLLGIGMIVFAISDVLLAQVAIRHRHIRSIHDVVWLIYSVGQMLIALSIFEAVSF